ncbi:IS1182 family transposase [Thermodesulfobacteriota bacterium]
MMGHQSDYQHKLFITDFNLEKRIPKNHILRKISEKIDFDFIYKEVDNTYGPNGNVSVPPPIILKLMLLLFLYKVPSERELMNTLPVRLDWLWFLGYDLEDDIPNHSVLSKVRARWGVDAFKKFFELILWQCVEAGLVDGCKSFVDSSLIDADASNNSVVNTQSLKKYLKKSYRRLEGRLDDIKEQKTTPANNQYMSTTDPDASVIRRGKGRSKLRYKTHRAVDEKHEVITATKITTGSVDDGEIIGEIIDLHEQNTQSKIDTVVADTKYGSVDNYLHCHDKGIEAHIPSIEASNRGSGRRKGIFPKEKFIFNPDTDTFICPAGEVLTRQKYKKKRSHFEYKASSKACNNCNLKDKCTRSKFGRTLKRHVRQDDLDAMVKCARSKESKKNLRTRKHLSERSFARATQYGYKRARWRNLWRMEIQDYLIAAIQNIKVLINQPKPTMSKSNVEECRKPGSQCLKMLINCCYTRLKIFIKPDLLFPHYLCNS